MSLRISGCKTLKHQYIFIWGGIDVKNRMKKRCMASILALVMMCLLGACGTDKADTKLYHGTFSGCRTRSVDIGTVRGTDDDL